LRYWYFVEVTQFVMATIEWFSLFLLKTGRHWRLPEFSGLGFLFLVGICLVHSLSFLCRIVLFYLSPFCVLCAQCCQCLWIVHSWLTLWVSLPFINITDKPRISHRYNVAVLLVLWCLTPLSTIFQLHRGVSYIGERNHTITTMTTPKNL
jgi:hypothetical protein